MIHSGKWRVVVLSLSILILVAAIGARMLYVSKRDRQIDSQITILMDRDLEWDARKQAQEELAGFARAAVPALMEQLDFDPTDPHDYERPFLACETFSKMGAEARAAIPALIPLLEDHSDTHVMAGAYMSGVAAEALGKIGKPSIPALLPVLKSQDWRTRAVALCAFRLMGADASGATAHLLPLLEDPSSNVRCAAARAFGSMGAKGEKAAARLTALLADEDEENDDYRGPYQFGSVSRNAMKALTEIGAPAVPHLEKALDENNPKIRSAAREVLDWMAKREPAR